MKGNRFSQIRWGEVAVFFVMFAVGVAVFLLQLWTWAIPQLTLYQEFIPARGLVLDKRVAELPIESGTLYRPEVYLEYRVERQVYRIWAFDYAALRPKGGFTPEKARAEALLKPFETGRRVNCWYRVNDPEQVVAVWTTAVWGGFLLLLALSLIILGIIGGAQSFRLSVLSQERQAYSAGQRLLTRPLWATIPDVQNVSESPGTHLAYRLPVSNKPVLPLAGLLIFTAAWTLVTAMVFVQSLADPMEWRADKIVNIFFCLLFSGAGAVLYWFVFRQVWLAVRIMPTLLEISDHPVYPGRKYRILLHQDGSLHFEQLTLDVVCEEIARFHQGTDTATNRQEVFRQTLFAQKSFTITSESPLHQEFFLQLPLGSMHSFRQQNNEIVWNLVFDAVLTDRSQICRTYPIVVFPASFNETALEGSGL